MYDLTVDGVHAFYVNSGISAILVHNCAAENVIAPKDANPFFPSDISTNEWGAQVWGKGAQDALNAVGLRTPQELQSLGLGATTARGLANFYARAAAAGRGGATAPARQLLMESIANLLEGG
jgi:hypothetical protein